VRLAEPRQGVDTEISVFNPAGNSLPAVGLASLAVSVPLLCPGFHGVVGTLPQSPAPLFEPTVTFICIYSSQLLNKQLKKEEVGEESSFLAAL